MHTYRWTIKTGNWRTRDQIQPGGKREARRDSKPLRANAIKAFETQLSQTIPCEETAEARLEYTDSHGYTTTLAKYVGRPLSRNPHSGAALSGIWTHDDGDLEGCMSPQVFA
jgi:hypothetical protein